MGKIQDAFTSTDPKMVQLRMQMFEQAGVLPLPGQPTIQGQIVPGPGQHRRYPADDITEQTICTLQMPFGRSGRKKEVAQGVVLPPDNDTTYDGKPIPPDYAKVVVAWTNTEFEEDELDIPTEDGIRFIGGTIGSCVLWNKSDILLEMPTPMSQPSQPSSSPAASPSDYNEGGGDDNGGDDQKCAGGPSNTPQRSVTPDNCNTQEGIGATPSEVTPPPTSGSNQGSNQCPPPPPRKPEDEAIPPNHTKSSWVAYQIANKHPFSTTFERYGTSMHHQYIIHFKMFSAFSTP